MRRALFFLAALLTVSAVSAQQYKWVDQNGKVQYGDLPPAGVKATPLKPPPSPNAPAPAKGSTAAKKDGKALTPEQAFQKRQQEERDRLAKGEKDKAEAANKKYNCEQARLNMRNLERGRVSQTNDQGEQVYLDEAQLAQQRERGNQAISEWCN